LAVMNNGLEPLKSPGNIIFSSNIIDYMFLNNCWVIVFNDLYVQQINKVVWGVTPPTPFCDVNRGRLCLDRTSNTWYMQVHSSPSREFVRFEKRFFSCIFRQCRPAVLLLDTAKQLKMGSACKSFPALCSKHFEPSCFENAEYTSHFDMKRKIIFLNMTLYQQFFSS
jgi:hypothetical protein